MLPSLGASPNKLSETLWQREDCNITVQFGRYGSIQDVKFFDMNPDTKVARGKD